MVEAAYFDSSVLVKLYDTSEKGAPEAEALFRRRRPYSSTLLYPEIISAFARKVRRKELAKENVATILGDFKRDYSQIMIVGLTDEVIHESERLLFTHPLTAPDSIHLASVLILRRELEQPVPFVTADKDQALASQKEGLETFVV